MAIAEGKEQHSFFILQLLQAPVQNIFPFCGVAVGVREGVGHPISRTMILFWMVPFRTKTIRMLDSMLWLSRRAQELINGKKAKRASLTVCYSEGEYEPLVRCNVDRKYWANAISAKQRLTELMWAHKK